MTDRENDRSLNASLAGLLRIEEAGNDWTEQDLQAIWRHQLRTALAEQFGSREFEPAETTFEQLFALEAPNLERLQQIKRFAKESAASRDGLPRDVAGVLYLVAIAAARLRLGEKITETADGPLAEKLRWAASQSWLDPQTAEMLQTAIKSMA